MVRKRNYAKQGSAGVKALERRLTKETERILSSQDEWNRFLITAARFINYPFHNQILIYAQKPESIGAATFDIWSGRCGLRVLPGTHGFPVLERLDTDHPRIITLHDRSNIGEWENGPKMPTVWKFPTENLHEMAAHICKGDTHERDPELSIWNWAGMQIEESDAQNILDLCADKGYSLDKDIRMDNSRSDAEYLKDFMHSAVAYEAFARCGLNLEKCGKWNDSLLEGNPYTLNSLFQSDEDAIGFLGDGISKAAISVFSVIRTEIRQFEREKALEGQEKKRSIRTEPEPVPVTQEEAKKGIEKAKSTGRGQSQGNFHITDEHLGEGGAKEKNLKSYLEIQKQILESAA